MHSLLCVVHLLNIIHVGLGMDNVEQVHTTHKECVDVAQHTIRNAWMLPNTHTILCKPRCVVYLH